MPVLAQRIVAIAGPTASGKTERAVKLAQKTAGEIFSVDSRQVYRGLDLGSGKDIHLYGQAIPCHLIDLVAPADPFSLYQYQQCAYERLEDWRSRRGPWHPAILCGGSGLYLEAVLKKYRIANVPEDKGLREALQARDKETLWRELQTLDPEWSGRTDASSKKRIIRALEVAYSRREGTLILSPVPAWPLDALVVVVQTEKKSLHRRIAERLQTRLDRGLIEEVSGLLREGLPLARLQQLGLEYREVGEYLAGHRSRDEMAERLRKAIGDFAKRQETWFRGLPKRGIPTLPMPEDADEEWLFHAMITRWPDLETRFFSKREPTSRFALAAVLDRDNQILLVKRSDDDTFAPGQWGLPGGHLQAGETPMQALTREIGEELGKHFSFEIGNVLPPVRDSLYGGRYEIHLARLHYRGGKVVLNDEHSRYAWVSPQEYRDYAVVPGVDEDLAYLQIWEDYPFASGNLPNFLKGPDRPQG